MEQELKAVQVVTIKAKHQIFKGDEVAERIELIELEENGFDLISQKDLYQVGDKAVYIQPDYNLSDIPLFESFLRPGGDISKSMLGKVNGIPLRIRAKKFNFHRGDAQPIYSNGVLLPYEDVQLFLFFDKYGNKTILQNLEDKNLVELLGITKWEEPENVDKAGNKISGTRKFPEGVYKTDETNINNLWNHIENKITYPVTLIGTEKVDGSSITIGVRDGKGFICSRNQQLDFIVKKHNGRRNKTFIEKLLFWTKPDLNLYKEVENDSDFIKYGKPYLDKLIENNLNNIILRGELNGSHLKGSGNKNNPSSKEQPNIKLFGIDTFNDKGVVDKAPYHLLKTVCTSFEFPIVKEIFIKEFNSKEEIVQECQNYFKDNLIEGIVIRNIDSTFSAKLMCDLYDSKK